MKEIIESLEKSQNGTMLKSTKRLITELMHMPEAISILSSMPEDIDFIWHGHPDELLILNVFDKMLLAPKYCNYYKNNITFTINYSNWNRKSIFSPKSGCSIKGRRCISMLKKDLKRLVKLVKGSDFELLMNFI